MIREAIDAVVSGKSLSIEEAASVMREIMEGQASPAQLGALLTALRMKGETPEEIAGMAMVMREKALKVQVEGLLAEPVGTGGDGKGTFNISTAAAFVAAGAGLKVAKHGNRAASGACGSADVLEALGVKIDLGPDGVKQCIEEIGIGFMFAPVFHPAMKYAAPVRREIGIRTVFNILGPLTNPAGAQAQVLGVPSLALGEKMAQVLKLLGTQHTMVVHGEDGLDELTLGARTHIWEVQGDEIHHYVVSPEELNMQRVPLEKIKGGTPQENAKTMRTLFLFPQGPLRDVVLLNSAAVLVVGGKAKNLKEGMILASMTLSQGLALNKLEELIEWTKTATEG